MAKKKEKAELVNVLEGMVDVQLHDDAAKEKYPVLSRLLLPIHSETKLLREEGYISITADGPHWKVTINCPTEEKQTVFAVPSLIDLFEQVEALLVAHKAIWKDSYKKRERARRALHASIK